MTDRRPATGMEVLRRLDAEMGAHAARFVKELARATREAREARESDFTLMPPRPEEPEMTNPAHKEWSDHADLLRRAAAHVRAVAEAATHDGRPTWTTTRTLGSGTPVVVDDAEQPSVVIESYAASYEDVLPHIALWHPQVALAVADWLDSTQTQRDARILRIAHEVGGEPHSAVAERVKAAVTVAHQILGEEAHS